MRLVFGILIAALLAAVPAQAQQASDTAVYPPQTQIAPAPLPVVPGGTTIQTTAPVTSDTKISVGTYAGEVLTWLAAAFSVPLGVLATGWLMRLFKSAGLVMTQQMQTELNKVLVNGLNDAATNGAKLANNKMILEVKDPIVASAIQYTIDRMPETLKGLGLDPADGDTVKVLRAKIATLAADPTVPTPPTAGNGSMKKVA
jgi:hypothetical protein